MTRVTFVLATMIALFLGTAGIQPAEAGKAKVLKVKKAPKLKKGLKVATTDEMTMDLSIDTGKTGVMAFSITKATPSTAKLVKVEASRATKIEVLYGAVTATQAMAGKVENQPDARAGKAYVVEATDAGLTVVDPAGGAVDAATTALVTEDWDGMMKAIPIRTFLIGRALTVGAMVALTEAEFDQIFPMDDQETTVKTFEVTLDKLTKKLASFSFKAVFDIVDKSGVPMSIDSTGAFTVDVKKVLPLTLEVTGTVSGKANGMNVTGTLHAKKAYKFK